MAKLDEEQVQQFRGIIREEVRVIVREEVSAQLDQKLDQKLEPLYEKLDQIRTAQIEDAAAVATDIIRLTRHSADHEKRIKKLEQARS